MEDTTSGRHNWKAVMRETHADPYEWIHVPDVTQPTASRVRTKHLAAVRDFLDLVGGDVEVQQDPFEQGAITTDTWVRWVPEGGEEDDE